MGLCRIILGLSGACIICDYIGLHRDCIIHDSIEGNIGTGK